MSYRQRFAQPNDRQIETYVRDKSYRNVFATPEGQYVLDDICQRLCGLDALNQIINDIQAYDVIARRNVGIAIATLALGPPDSHKQPEVKI